LLLRAPLPLLRLLETSLCPDSIYLLLNIGPNAWDGYAYFRWTKRKCAWWRSIRCLVSTM